MNQTTDAMRFVRSAPLGLPALILLALAIAAFIVWLAVGTRDPNVVDVLKWIAAGVIGVAGIAYAASWEEIVIDPASGRVTDRSGLLGWSTEKQSAFSDFANVLVERASVTKMEHNAKPAIHQALSDGPSPGHSFALKLRGAAREITLTQQDDPLVLETSARQIARLGAWTAKRAQENAWPHQASGASGRTRSKHHQSHRLRCGEPDRRGVGLGPARVACQERLLTLTE
jgi:hypothetical protein